MAIELEKKDSKITWWQYIIIGVVMFFVGYGMVGSDNDLGRAIITIGWGPVIVGIVKFFKKS
jgi:hypothetical protein